MDLTDTTVRAYRKRDRRISLHVRGHHLVRTNRTFRLGAYMRTWSCHILFPDGRKVLFDDVGFTDDAVCECSYGTMAHAFFASTTTEFLEMSTSLVRLHFTYQLSFSGNHLEKPGHLEKTGVVVRYMND